MRTSIQINPDPKSHKIGINEVAGLKAAMMEVFKPIEACIQDKAYWTRGDSIVEESEYKRRDGFIPHSHNCGGLEIGIVVPECEKYDFDFLTFGEWDGEHYCGKSDTENCECPYGTDGENDAYLRIWFKFEGICESTGRLQFYLYCGGGNGDAPYFRTKYSEDYFEASFECASVEGIKRAASKHIKALLNKIA